MACAGRVGARVPPTSRHLWGASRPSTSRGTAPAHRTRSTLPGFSPPPQHPPPHANSNCGLQIPLRGLKLPRLLGGVCRACASRWRVFSAMCCTPANELVDGCAQHVFRCIGWVMRGVLSATSSGVFRCDAHSAEHRQPPANQLRLPELD